MELRSGKTGLDYCVKKITEVYRDFNHKRKSRTLFMLLLFHIVLEE